MTNFFSMLSQRLLGELVVSQEHLPTDIAELVLDDGELQAVVRRVEDIVNHGGLASPEKTSQDRNWNPFTKFTFGQFLHILKCKALLVSSFLTRRPTSKSITQSSHREHHKLIIFVLFT